MDLAQLHFAQPLLLWLLAPITLLCLWSLIANTQSRVALLFRLLLLSALVLALAQPQRVQTEQKEELLALLDISGSIPSRAQDEMLSRLAGFTAESRTLKILRFGSGVSKEAVEVSTAVSADALRGLIAESAETPARDGTDISTALVAAQSLSPAAPILLLSDGQDTTQTTIGSLQAGQSPVFPLVLESEFFEKSQIEITSLHAQLVARVGERVTIYSSVRNNLNSERTSTLEIWLEEKKLSSKKLLLAPGTEEQVRIDTPKLEGGLQRIRAVLLNEDGSSSTRHRWISVKEKSKLLLLHGAQEDKAELQELVRLKGYAAEHVVAQGDANIPEDFSSFSGILLNNIAKHQLPAGYLKKIEQFSKSGGGVLLIGGERSFGLGGYIDTPIEKISPLKFKPPQTKKKRLRVALALVMDKSGSMGEQDRLLAAKRAAVRSMDSLKDEDYITIIGFDNTPFLLVDISPVSQARQDVEKRLRNLTPAGQTNLLPALGMARQKLIRAPAGRKHMIVLSDGQFSLSTSVYVEEINRLKREGVTISSVALGSEADIPFLKFLAQTGRGAFHHTLDASKLPDIFLEDIKIATGEETMAEQDLYPVGKGPAGIRSTRVNRFPPLRGFVETLPKKGSALELITRRKKSIFPILASWNYGKGRVAAFTSDVNGRWSQTWLRWPQFVQFWSELIDWIRTGGARQASDIDFDLRSTTAQGGLQFELIVYDKNLKNSAAPPIQTSLITPGNEKQSPVFTASAPGRFNAALANAEAGDYRLSISYGNTELPPVGITVHDDAFGEQAGKGIDYRRLERLARSSGGMINPNPDQLPLQRSTQRTETALYPWLLAFAFIAVLLEAILRERTFARI